MAEGTLRRGRDRQAGFGLIEVVVAVAILALGLGVLLRGLTGGIAGARTAERDALALAFAQSKLAEIAAIRPLELGELGGVADGGLAWRAEVARHADHGLFGAGPPPQGLVQAYTIRVAVSFRDDPRRRPVTLATLRLEPGPGR